MAIKIRLARTKWQAGGSNYQVRGRANEMQILFVTKTQSIELYGFKNVVHEQPKDGGT